MKTKGKMFKIWGQERYFSTLECLLCLHGLPRLDLSTPYKLGMGPLRGTQRKITQVCYMPAEIKIMSSRFSERLYFKRTYQRMIEDI